MIPDADTVLKRSLKEVKRTIDVKKVCLYVQVVGAERLRAPWPSGKGR